MTYFIIGLVVAFDQISKYLAVKYLKPIGSKEIIADIFHLTYKQNTGAAFSIMQDKKWFLILLPVIMIGVCLYILVSKKVSNKWCQIALAFIIGGGIGNLIDRIFSGYVVDFFEIKFVNFAVFNVADCFVVIGAISLIAALIFDKEFLKNN